MGPGALGGPGRALGRGSGGLGVEGVAGPWSLLALWIPLKGSLLWIPYCLIRGTRLGFSLTYHNDAPAASGPFLAAGVSLW